MLIQRKRYERLLRNNEECLKTFLEKQEQLFDEPVAETLEAAEAFLEDCMAVVVESLAEVREYFEENGMDVDGMSEEELEEASEVFALPDGTYLIVEG
mgnify:CR=1 FL=1